MKHLFSCALGSRLSRVISVASVNEILEDQGSWMGKILWVCDEHTRMYVPEGTDCVVLPSGEGAKRWDSIETILGKAAASGLGRDGKIIAVGGGVVCDLGAFAASIFMRGCAVSLVPTTLLAMVDASLGGKTGFDLFGMKNLVGTFHPAHEVYILAQSLRTLDDAEYRNGLGEVLKHAILSEDDRLATYLEENRGKLLSRDIVSMERMIVDSLKVKQSYVESDPTETKGIRDALNLGHTFAHALESVGNLTRFSHGEAVAWGVVKALHAGVSSHVTPVPFATRHEKLIRSYGFDVDVTVSDRGRFFEALRHDKKKRASQVRFVLMEGQGRHLLQPLTQQQVMAVLGFSGVE
ncbi:MAG: 3-dehydroquinate synthase [Sphaerochaetaceae bacterium]|nr:3-dehydroquinate synthase [Sphaerochaetaceae bacterium]